MIERTLGRTGWSVGELGCGTYRSFDQGGSSGLKAVAKLVEANRGAGVNLFDTAPMYGRAEETLGHALHSAPPWPAGPLIASKVLQQGLAGARKQIEQSFRLLDRIDLLQIHNMAGWRAVLPYLVELKAAGRIAATGVTHYQPSAFGEIEAACKTGDVDVIQIPYNVMERQAERRLLPLAAEMNLGVLVMTPIEPIFARRELLSRLGAADLEPYREYGVTDGGSLCLKYLLSKNPDVVLIPATSRPARVASNAAVSGPPPIPPDLLARLEKQVG